MYTQCHSSSIIDVARKNGLGVLKRSVVVGRMGRNVRLAVPYSPFGRDAFLKGYCDWFSFESGIVGQEDRMIDISVLRPFMFSNSYFCYERGRRGVNIDPIPGFKRCFGKARPTDTNLDARVSVFDDMATSFLFGQPSIYNSLDKANVCNISKETGITPSETKAVSALGRCSRNAPERYAVQCCC